jgi:hypothetical protein
VPFRGAIDVRHFLGDYVRDELILEHRDLIAQAQFSLLEPHELELVAAAAVRQSHDRAVEIAMLDPQQLQPALYLFRRHDADRSFIVAGRILVTADTIEPGPVEWKRWGRETALSGPFGLKPSQIGGRLSKTGDSPVNSGRQLTRIVIYFLSHIYRQGDLSMDSSHVSALQAKHAGLDARIKAESSRPMPDAALVASLKKQKLRVKEEMTLSH